MDVLNEYFQKSFAYLIMVYGSIYRFLNSVIWNDHFTWTCEAKKKKNRNRNRIPMLYFGILIKLSQDALTVDILLQTKFKENWNSCTWWMIVKKKTNKTKNKQ